jgi:hypothetical protein
MCMFQLFYTDVTKVDQDVADVAMVVHVCCASFLSVSGFLYTYFCKCFRR